MAHTPDTTPSAENRALFPDQVPKSEYGGRWQLPASTALAAETTVDMIAEPKAEVEQLDLFAQPGSPDEEVFIPKNEDQYGHVSGSSARNLRRADQIFIAQQARKLK